jgi:ATP-dependent Clp protease adaptor protein ClpS
MTRTLLYKVIYAAMLIGGFVVGIWSANHFHTSAAPVLFAVVIVAMLIPGRVLGYFWSDLLAGLKLLRRKDYASSKRHSERFIADLQRKPWLKNLIWLGSGVYTRDPLVMALNNLGAAEIGLNNFEAARSHLDRAIALDPDCPLPYQNIGMLYLKSGGTWTEATFWSEQAKARGYSGGLSDRLAGAFQSFFALTGGRVDGELKVPLLESLLVRSEPGGNCVVEIMNDDKTPMEYVVWLLQNVFGKSWDEATVIMMETHERGTGVCGAYSAEVAQAKVDSVAARNKQLGFDLKIRIVIVDTPK